MSFLTDFPDAKLYYAMCKEHVKNGALWDDCVQEAIIAVWQTEQKFPGKAKAYYNAVARRRIKRVSQDLLFFDAPPLPCGRWLPKARATCGRRADHPGYCVSKKALGKGDGDCRRTNASHDVMRRNPDSLDQINGWSAPEEFAGVRELV